MVRNVHHAHVRKADHEVRVPGRKPSMSMSFVLPEELQMLRDNLRRYVNTEMIPYEMESMEGQELKPKFRDKFQDRKSTRLNSSH